MSLLDVGAVVNALPDVGCARASAQQTENFVRGGVNGLMSERLKSK